MPDWVGIIDGAGGNTRGEGMRLFWRKSHKIETHSECTTWSRKQLCEEKAELGMVRVDILRLKVDHHPRYEATLV